MTNIEFKKGSPTIAGRGNSIGMGMPEIIKGFGVLFGSALMSSMFDLGHQFVWLGFAGMVFYFLKGFYLAIFGKTDFVRQGECPHCSSPVVLRNCENASAKCNTCKRPLVLREETIYDVS